ncbi:MAG: GNAT family N-acetyltransferase [Verrucomicrobia bacterium]|nr:GNAT family N-acetyltransferase [Verrucomicrobiota bacterium]
MRFLLDTNILIPLENSKIVLEESLAHFVRLAQENGHQLVYHPASEDDIRRDKDLVRRQRTMERLGQYTRIQDRLPCPWNTPQTNPNDSADNEILYALGCAAAHALVTEDRGIHDKARARGLVKSVLTIQTACDWLRRLHETKRVTLPNIEDKELSFLTPHLGSTFFDSLRAAYHGFDDWFREKARQGKRAWVAFETSERIGALCVYDRQTDELIAEGGLTLPGHALKLCTFKVAESVRGQKIGELFLKAAFRYASANQLEHIFIHGDVDQHHLLFEMLESFGFENVGTHPGSNNRDAVYLKKHPVAPPDEALPPFDYLRRYFPHFRSGPDIGKYVIPIQPGFHEILFPDYDSPDSRQLRFQSFQPSNRAGNAIKLAYLCHAQTNQINPGDILLFYRSRDERAITSVGVAEQYTTLNHADDIAALVKRRTVYSMNEIASMASKPTRALLFRLVRHLDSPRSQAWLEVNHILKGAPQSITKIKHEAFQKLFPQ